MKQILSFLFAWATIFVAQAANNSESVGQVSGTKTVSTATDLHITSATPFTGSGSVNITHAEAVVIIEGVKPSVVKSTWLSRIKVNGVAAAHNTNCRVGIWKNGTIVYPHPNTGYTPLTVYTETNYGGDSSNDFGLTTYYNGLGSMTNKIRSLKLKRGYMATLACNTDGTGYSRVFIAQDADLEVADLGSCLSGRVAFIRVFPWQKVTKKGLGGTKDYNHLLNATWSWNWGANNVEYDDEEYVPSHEQEAWPSWSTLMAINKSNHMLGHCEPDNRNGEHITVAQIEEKLFKTGSWQKMYKTGMRVGSPAPGGGDDGDQAWLDEFMRCCREYNCRIDFIQVHKYWHATGSQFNTEMNSLYSRYQRSIWITEWNYGGNWTTETWPDADRSGTASNYAHALAGIQSICTALEANSHVERYSIYNWVQDCRKIYNDEDASLAGKNYLTPAGEYYSALKSNTAYMGGDGYVMQWNYKAPTGLSLTYSRSDHKVSLTWNCLNGKQTDKILVERKVEGTDESFVTVASYGMSEKTTFVLENDDVSSCSGRVIYRIHNIDSDGSHRYSNEVAVSVIPFQQTDVTSCWLTNADFQGNRTVAKYPNGSLDQRAIYQPNGWSIGYTPTIHRWSYTVMTSDDLDPATIRSKTGFELLEGEKKYLVRLYKGNADSIRLSQTVTVPTTGIYTFSADLIAQNNYITTTLFVGGQMVRNSTKNTWQKRSLTLQLTKGQTVNVGLKFERTNDANNDAVAGADNVVVQYVGNVGIEQLSALIMQARNLNAKTGAGLDATITAAQNVYNEIDYSPECQELIDDAIASLRTAIENTLVSYSFNAGGDDLTGLIANASFDLSDDGMQRAAVSSAENAALPIPGWTQSNPGTQYNNAMIVDGDHENKSESGKLVAPSDGSYYLYYRHGWNGSGTTCTFTSADVPLPMGCYHLTVDYKAVGLHDGNGGNTTVTLKATNSTGELCSVTSSNATTQSYGSRTNVLANEAWNTLSADFQLERMGYVNVVLQLFAGAQRRSDFVLDHVTLTYTPVTITISENNSYTPPAGTANVVLNRTIKKDTWNTFVVPFSMNYTELKAAFGNSVEIAEYSETAVGENSSVTFNKMVTPAVSANVPVLLKTSTVGSSYTLNGRVIESAAEPKVEGAGNFDFVGSYDASTVIAEGDYYISNNSIYRSTGLGSTIKGTRAYIKAKGAGARIAQFVIDDNGQTNAIERMDGGKSRMEEGILYDLQGRRVGTRLKKGIYILQGKKVVR